eukprot:1000648-Rhodomonas_salina.3
MQRSTLMVGSAPCWSNSFTIWYHHTLAQYCTLHSTIPGLSTAHCIAHTRAQYCTLHNSIPYRSTSIQQLQYSSLHSAIPQLSTEIFIAPYFARYVSTGQRVGSA